MKDVTGGKISGTFNRHAVPWLWEFWEFWDVTQLIVMKAQPGEESHNLSLVTKATYICDSCLFLMEYYFRSSRIGTE